MFLHKRLAFLEQILAFKWCKQATICGQVGYMLKKPSLDISP